MAASGRPQHQHVVCNSANILSACRLARLIGYDGGMDEDQSTAMGPADIQAWKAVNPPIGKEPRWYSSPRLHFALAVIPSILVIPAIGGPLVAVLVMFVVALPTLWLFVTIAHKLNQKKTPTVIVRDSRDNWPD